MSAEVKKEIGLEIAHVLFIDSVQRRIGDRFPPRRGKHARKTLYFRRMQRRVAAEQDPTNSRNQPMKVKMTASDVATDPARGTGEKDISYEIPVLRSEAFAR